MNVDHNLILEAPFIGYTVYTSIYFLGNEAKLLRKHGPVKHFSDLWNVLDFTCFSFVLSYMLLHVLELAEMSADYENISYARRHIRGTVDVELVEAITGM